MQEIKMAALLDSKSVSVNNLRTHLSQVRQAVQFKGEKVAVTYHGQTVGVVIPVDTARTLLLDPVKVVKLRLADFRDSLTEQWELIQSGRLDGVLLTFHDREVMAFVSPKLIGVTEC